MTKIRILSKEDISENSSEEQQLVRPQQLTYNKNSGIYNRKKSSED